LSARFVWSGLEELKAQLRSLPSELAGEGGHIVEARGNGAVVTIRSGYPSRTGDLRDHVTVEHTQSAFGARSVIRNTSKHAEEFELGTQARHNSLGANRGSMPANHLFTQTIMRERRAMYGDFADLLVRHGLSVTGTV
jgi:hypothetical protein